MLNYFQRYIAEEYVDHYKDGEMSRRSMLRRVMFLAGGAAMAVGFLKEMGVNVTAEEVLAAGPDTLPASQGNAVTVQPDDPAIRAGWIIYTADDGAPLIGYLARPADMSLKYPGIIQVHENRGPTDHHQDVARRFAKEGFVALLPDLLSRAGGLGAIADAAQVPALVSASPERNVGDLRAAVATLMARDEVRPGGVGAVGYCFGGGMVWRTVMADPNVIAGVPYYGPTPPAPLDAASSIKAKILAFYASDDNFVNPRRGEMEDALKTYGVPYQFIEEPDTRHAFFNDTGQSYSPSAAADAWPKTLAFFRDSLPQG
jgi:carboxymethylenebutenolidase